MASPPPTAAPGGPAHPTDERFQRISTGRPNPTGSMAGRRRDRWFGGGRGGTLRPVSPEPKAPLDPLDFLAVDSLLSDEERAVRDTVRRFVRDRVLPGIAEWFEAGRFPKEVAPELGRLGLLGMHLDGFGCAGSSAVQYGLACAEL